MFCHDQQLYLVWISLVKGVILAIRESSRTTVNKLSRGYYGHINPNKVLEIVTKKATVWNALVTLTNNNGWSVLKPQDEFNCTKHKEERKYNLWILILILRSILFDFLLLIYSFSLIHMKDYEMYTTRVSLC